MFLGGDVGLVLLDGGLPRFLLYILAFRSRSEKFSSRQVFCFWFCSLFLVFPSSSFWFGFFQEIELRASNTHPTLHSLVLFFSFLSLPHLANRPFWPCVLSFSRFVGVPFWAPGVLAIFGFSGTLEGFRLLAPF